jgi:hypothetical protein
LTCLQTFALTRGLDGPLTDARVLAVVCRWWKLTSLIIEDSDMEVLKCLAQHCPALRSLRAAFFPHPLPDIPTTPVLSHALSELEFYELKKVRVTAEASWEVVDVHLLASHLDRLFPQVSRISGNGWDGRWDEVAELVAVKQAERRAV